MNIQGVSWVSRNTSVSSEGTSYSKLKMSIHVYIMRLCLAVCRGDWGNGYAEWLYHVVEKPCKYTPPYCVWHFEQVSFFIFIFTIIFLFHHAVLEFKCIRWHRLDFKLIYSWFAAKFTPFPLPAQGDKGLHSLSFHLLMTAMLTLCDVHR